MLRRRIWCRRSERQGLGTKGLKASYQPLASGLQLVSARAEIWTWHKNRKNSSGVERQHLGRAARNKSKECKTNKFKTREFKNEYGYQRVVSKYRTPEPGKRH